MIELDPERLHIAFNNTYKMVVEGWGIEDVLDDLDLGVVNDRTNVRIFYRY